MIAIALKETSYHSIALKLPLIPVFRKTYASHRFEEKNAVHTFYNLRIFVFEQKFGGFFVPVYDTSTRLRTYRFQER